MWLYFHSCLHWWISNSIEYYETINLFLVLCLAVICLCFGRDDNGGVFIGLHWKFCGLVLKLKGQNLMARYLRTFCAWSCVSNKAVPQIKCCHFKLEPKIIFANKFFIPLSKLTFIKFFCSNIQFMYWFQNECNANAENALHCISPPLPPCVPLIQAKI